MSSSSTPRPSKHRTSRPLVYLLLVILVTLVVVGGLAMNAQRSAQPLSPQPATPASIGYTWGPGEEEWDEWDATVDESYPTPLPTGVVVMPQDYSFRPNPDPNRLP